MKPEEYLTLKKVTISESSKNGAVNETFIREKGKDVKNIREKST